MESHHQRSGLQFQTSCSRSPTRWSN